MSKILIIDDDSEQRDILRLRLESDGFQISEAQDGEEGLLMAQQSEPHAIIMDAMMPKMDGWKLCRKLRSDSKTKTIPLIMLTASGKQTDELLGFESGADEYLTKPCDHQLLLETLSRCLSNAKEADQL